MRDYSDRQTTMGKNDVIGFVLEPLDRIFWDKKK